MSEAARARARYTLGRTGMLTIGGLDEVTLRLHLNDWITNPAGPAAFHIERVTEEN